MSFPTAKEDDVKMTHKMTIGNKTFRAEQENNCWRVNQILFTAVELKALGADIEEIKPERNILYAHLTPSGRIVFSRNKYEPDFIAQPEYDFVYCKVG